MSNASRRCVARVSASSASPMGSARSQRTTAIAAGFKTRRHRDGLVDVEGLSKAPIEQLLIATDATWLDRELAVDAPLPLRDAGFGRHVFRALSPTCAVVD